MSRRFVARKGLLALDDSTIVGGLTSGDVFSPNISALENDITLVATNSGKWDLASTRTTNVAGTSATWDLAYQDILTIVNTLSANWQSTFTTVKTLSAGW